MGVLNVTPDSFSDGGRWLDPEAAVAGGREFLGARAGGARAAGVAEVWIDPGLGFAKTAAHNLSLLHALNQLAATGYPVLVGASRKSFIGRLTGDAPVDDRLEG